MNGPSPELIRATLNERERQARKILARGRVPCREERRLKRKVEQARRMYETYGGHGYEIEVARAEDALERFLDRRAQEMGRER